MANLKWSRDLGESVLVRTAMTAEEALNVLVDALLGEDYYAEDLPGKTDERHYADIVRDILSKYAPKRKVGWFK